MAPTAGSRSRDCCLLKRQKLKDWGTAILKFSVSDSNFLNLRQPQNWNRSPTMYEIYYSVSFLVLVQKISWFNLQLSITNFPCPSHFNLPSLFQLTSCPQLLLITIYINALSPPILWVHKHASNWINQYWTLLKGISIILKIQWHENLLSLHSVDKNRRQNTIM